VFRSAGKGAPDLVEAAIQAQGEAVLSTVDDEGFGTLGRLFVGWQRRLETFPESGWQGDNFRDLFHTVLRSHPQAVSAGCPLSEAVQMRFVHPAQLLLESEALDPACLERVNAANETVLHLAATAHAPGLARILFRAAKAPSEQRERLGKLLGLDYSAMQLLSPELVSYRSIVAGASAQDLELLLNSGQRLGLDVPRWIRQRDALGRTALDVACQEGRTEAVGVLLERASEQERSDCQTWLSRNGFGEHWVGYDSAQMTLAAEIERFRTVAPKRKSFGWNGLDLQALDRVVAAAISAFPQPWRPKELAEDGSDSWLERAHQFAQQCRQGGSLCVLRAKRRDGCSDWTCPPDATRMWRRGASISLPLGQATSRRSVLSKIGHWKVTASAVPYAQGYGLPSRRVSLEEFLTHSSREYVFQAVKYRSIVDSLPVLHESVLSSGDRSHIVEFMAGGAETGAMMHFHGATTNSVLVGAKLWVVVPPSCAVFCTVPAMRWLTERAATDLASCPNIFVFVQLAGDVVILPRHWGHAVVNLQDTIAVAYEQYG
jgi:hypothetical protein